MASFFVDIELGGSGAVDSASVNALVDTETTHTAVPGTVLRKLGVESRARPQLKQADGQTVQRGLARRACVSKARNSPYRSSSCRKTILRF